MAAAGSREDSIHQEGSPRTIEPSPPLSLGIRLDRLERFVRGGVASLVIDASSVVDLDDLAVTLRLPEGAIFTDGSRVRTWSIGLGAGRGARIPAQLLTARDGRYPLTVEAIGLLRGRPIRRAAVFDLGVGEALPPLPRRHGAVEFRGVPAAGKR